MGCSDSKLDSYSTQVHVSIIDPAFLKPANEPIRQSIKDQGIIVNTYMSVDCFISDQKASYSHHIVVKQQELEDLMAGLQETNSHPKIFVLNKNKIERIQADNQKNITHIKSYQQLISGLSQPQKTLISSVKKKLFVDVLILKENKSESQPELYIFEQTLKIKEISYKIFRSFQELDENIKNMESPVIVTDYVYQQEVVSLVVKKKIKVICYTNFEESQNYHPYVSFITNNFQEIVNQIAILKSFKVTPLPTSKIFLCSSNKQFFRFKSTFEECGLKVRLFLNARQILKVTKYYFSLVIVCPEEEKSIVLNEIAAQGLSFRVQVIGIMEETDNSVKGLRKILRQVKRGYLAEKNVCKMVDIIDKYHDSSKFQDIKKELTKYQIQYRCFQTFSSFTKNQVYCSPLIICSFNERHLLARYLQQVECKSKIIIYCNKNKISTAMMEEHHRWTYVTSQFGKIINFIRTNKILVPVVLDHNQKRIELQQQKIKKKQHRISALKWADPNFAANIVNTPNRSAKKAVSIKEPQVSFIIPRLNINPLEVKQICHDSSTLLRMPYEPPKQFQTFKKDLISSLIFLKDKYKIDFPEAVYEQLLETIKDKNLHLMALRIREFFGEEKEMGVKINQSLKKLQSIDNKELTHLRQIIYLMNLNFISYFGMPKIGTIRLVHWTKETLMVNCSPGGVVIFKNFLVMYEEGTIDPISDCIKLTFELDYNTLTDSNLPITPYFFFEGRYVFAPYTQFRISSMTSQNQSSVALEIIKQPDFLNYYIQQNLSPHLSEYFVSNIAESSPLVDPDLKIQVENRIQRCSILKMCKTSQCQKAVISQKQLLMREQEEQNIDSRYINELLYELANYQFKTGLIDDLLITVQEVTGNDPLPFIKKECLNFLAKANKQLTKETLVQNPIELKHYKKRTQKCIELKENIEKNEEESKSEQNSSCENVEQNIFELQKCMEIDDNFGGEFQFFE